MDGSKGGPQGIVAWYTGTSLNRRLSTEKSRLISTDRFQP